MNQSFYTATVGAWQQQVRLNVHGNNIANVNNYGFKAKKPVFSDLMYGYIQGAEQEEMPRGTGAYMVTADTDFSAMGLADTGRGAGNQMVSFRRPGPVCHWQKRPAD